MLRLISDAKVVFLCPAFLKANYLWIRTCYSESSPYFGQPFPSEMGYVFKPQAIISYNIQGSRTSPRRVHVALPLLDPQSKNAQFLLAFVKDLLYEVKVNMVIQSERFGELEYLIQNALMTPPVLLKLKIHI